MSILLIYCRQIHWRVVSKPAYPPWIYMKIPFRIKSWVLHWRFVESEVGNFWSFVVGWIGREAPLMQKKMMEVFQIKQARMESKIRRTSSEFRETKQSLILPAISSCWLSSRNTRRWSSLSLVGKELDWMFIPLVTAPMFQTSPKTNHNPEFSSTQQLRQPGSTTARPPSMKFFLRWDSHVEIHWNLYPGF